MDAEEVEALGDPDLVVEGEIDAFGLRSIAERGVVISTVFVFIECGVLETRNPVPDRGTGFSPSENTFSNLVGTESNESSSGTR